MMIESSYARAQNLMDYLIKLTETSTNCSCLRRAMCFIRGLLVLLLLLYDDMAAAIASPLATAMGS
jgi:hypothetical protein